MPPARCPPPRSTRTGAGCCAPPPVPDDVDADHPLRRCLERTAKLELNQLLFGEALEKEVLGLLTACGGGLTSAELQELTGRPPYEVDRLLGGAFGRTVAGRIGDPLTDEVPRRVYLFAHEELRAQATAQFGPALLADYRERIHGWAARYRAGRWPTHTPAYLLVGYPRMLDEERDVARLVELAVDRNRHERLLHVTGGDGAALAEIVAAMTMVSGREHPDLAHLLALAYVRESVSQRNARLPVAVPAAWARAGRLVRAETLARSMADPGRQAQAMVGLIVPMTDAGERAGAVRIAQDAAAVAGGITHRWLRNNTLLRLVTTLVEIGETALGREVAETIEDPAVREQAVRRLVRPTVRPPDELVISRSPGQIGDVLLPPPDAVGAPNVTWLKAAAAPDRQAEAWLSFAEQEPAGADRARLAYALDEAAKWVRAIAAPRRGRALRRLLPLLVSEDRMATARALVASFMTNATTGVAVAFHAAGEESAAAAAAVRTEAALAEWSPLTGDTVQICRALAVLDARQSAGIIARSINDPHKQAQACAAVMWAAVRASAFEEALSLAMAVRDTYWRKRHMSELAAHLVVTGQVDTGIRLLVHVEADVRETVDPSRDDRALIRTATALISAGMWSEAARTAGRVVDTTRRTALLRQVAAGHASRGEFRQALQVAETVHEADAQVEVLAQLVRAAAAKDEAAWVGTLAGKMQELALAVPVAHASTVAAAADALLAIGWYDQLNALADAAAVGNGWDAVTAIADVMRAGRRFDDAHRLALLMPADRRGQLLASLARSHLENGRFAAAAATIPEVAVGAFLRDVLRQPIDLGDVDGVDGFLRAAMVRARASADTLAPLDVLIAANGLDPDVDPEVRFPGVAADVVERLRGSTDADSIPCIEHRTGR